MPSSSYPWSPVYSVIWVNKRPSLSPGGGGFISLTVRSSLSLKLRQEFNTQFLLWAQGTVLGMEEDSDELEDGVSPGFQGVKHHIGDTDI